LAFSPLLDVFSLEKLDLSPLKQNTFDFINVLFEFGRFKLLEGQIWGFQPIAVSSKYGLLP